MNLDEFLNKKVDKEGEFISLPLEVEILKKANVILYDDIAYIALIGDYNDDFDEYEKEIHAILAKIQDPQKDNIKFIAFLCTPDDKGRKPILKVIDTKNKNYPKILKGESLDKFAKLFPNFYDLISLDPPQII